VSSANSLLQQGVLLVDAVRVGPRHRRDMGDIAAFAREIAEAGLKSPITVTPDGTLIAGERRLRAAKLLGTVISPAAAAPAEHGFSTLFLAATACRLQLLHSRYVPVATDGKHPVLKGWQTKTETNPNEIEMWARLFPHAFNTGILTQRTPALDLDVLIDDAASAVETLVRERFDEHGKIW
jgi:hypothetical protein